jgi:CHAD domain-containing protein
MAAHGIQYELPDGVQLDELGDGFKLIADRPREIERTFYDTFDARLHAAGLVLVAEDGRLRLLDGEAYGERAAAAWSGPGERVMLGELPAGALREQLARHVEMRALTPTARVRSRVRALRVLDAEGKTVVRLAVEAPAVALGDRRRVRLRDRLHVTPVRGYEKPLAQVCRTLEGELGLAPAGVPLHDAAILAAGGRPGGTSAKLDFALQPGQRADSAATLILQRLLDTIEANLPGTLADLDSEFLHDLRVAVRRSRSLQRQLKRAFPPADLARFRAEFRRLQQITGPTRDLDVYLLEFEEFAGGLEGELEPLRALLAARRETEQRRMCRGLRSARTRELLAAWRDWLAVLVAAPEDERPDAARPIGEVAGERIGAVYRRMLKMGRAIDDSSPHEALHDLRKQGKELRYLLEFFASLYPRAVIKPMVATLKSLQDTLGRFQDREVQAAMLVSLRDEVAALEEGPAALMAMGLLVERLEQQQAAARAEFAERFAAFSSKRQRALVRETFG